MLTNCNPGRNIPLLGVYLEGSSSSKLGVISFMGTFLYDHRQLKPFQAELFQFLMTYAPIEAGTSIRFCE
jgi:hypothetical protein